ncbi:hypothetical protein B0H14DRAFT_2648547 [Mycena olivaceomarginata]|nr:hypothetical protein B0H14DRAFT_2648547 [Mycena olivaceomarginata]
MTRQRPCPTGAEEDTEADEGRNTRAGENNLHVLRSRRLKPGPQRDLLLGLKDGNVVPYLDEGEGCVYFTGVLQKKAIQELHPKELPRQMIVKWGVSTCVSRRQLEYHACEVGQTQVWFCAFKVERRLLAGEVSLLIIVGVRLSCSERIIRLRLLDEGYALVKFEETLPVHPPPPRIPLHASGGLPGGNRKACGRILRGDGRAEYSMPNSSSAEAMC